MMIMPRENARARSQSHPASLSPRTKLPQIVGESRGIQEGEYPHGSSPIANNRGAYEDDDDGAHSDGGGQDSRRGTVDEPRELQLTSRADGRAWEDGEVQEEKDPLAQGFRELRILAQVVRKKAGTQEFDKEMSALELKIKRVNAHASSQYASVQLALKVQKKSNAALQQSLKGAKTTVNQTVSQAFDDVTLLTQKLKSVEEQFSQVRVDKEHIEKGFRSELAAVLAKNSALQKNLLSCKMEIEELSHRIKSFEDKTRQLTFDKLEAQKDSNSARAQLAVLEDDLTNVKQKEAKLLRDLATVRDQLDFEKSNLREELASFNAQREMANSEIVRLQVQRDNALKDGAKVEEYKGINGELKKALAQAQMLLDEAETVRKNGNKALQEQFKEEGEKLKQQTMLDTQGLQEQVRVLTNGLKASEEKAKYDREQAQLQLDALKLNSDEAIKTLSSANELLATEQQLLQQQVSDLQQQLVVKVQELTALSEGVNSSGSLSQGREAALQQAILDMQASNSESGWAAREGKLLLESAESLIAGVESALVNITLHVQRLEMDVLGKGSSSKANEEEPSFEVRAQQEELKTKVARLEGDVMFERERSEHVKRVCAALEAQAKKLKSQRDATSKLAKHFMLQLSRSKVERLAAMSIVSTRNPDDADAGGLIENGKVKTEVMQQQIALMKGLLVEAHKDQDQLTQLGESAAVLLGMGTGEQFMAQYIQEISDTRLTTPDAPAGLKRPKQSVAFRGEGLNAPAAGMRVCH